MRKVILSGAAAAALVVGMSALTPSADASGLLGGIINQVAPGVGDKLDDLHDQMGKPLDAVPGQVLDAYVPGLGRAYDAVRTSRQQTGTQTAQSQPKGRNCDIGDDIVEMNNPKPIGSICRVQTDDGVINGRVVK
jgi:hypothetical protein